MNLFRNIWQYSNLLSLDVVVGAMAGMLFFSDVLGTSLSIDIYGLLGLAVWAVYTADHLMDARRAKNPAVSERHRYHQKNFNLLSIILILVSISGLLYVLIIDSLRFILIPGIALAVCMVIWMGSIQYLGIKLAWLKEFSTALFYVLGIALAPFFSIYPDGVSNYFYLFLFGYFLIALLNLFILSFIDEKVDMLDGFGSALSILNKSGLERLILVLASIGGFIFFIALFLLPSYFRMHTLILLVLIIFHVKEFYDQDISHIRKKLEASFLLPLVLIAF
ncbi:hypothetical protein [Cecembia sp.]|uniref:hypothetical protein n=1 Tax=Cecembia sp. TaxID=1898110 RepID=UPI0025BFC83E|nr:hypothetical protein [Cecembia sp.]